MKYVGFIKENTNIKEAISFEDMIKSKADYDHETLKKIKSYLSNGLLVFSWMGYTQDPIKKVFIAPDGYSTDGEWIWPDYYYYYIDNYSIEVDREFFMHMSKVGFDLKISDKLLESQGTIEDEMQKKFNKDQNTKGE
ncbi:hypothetical protein [Pedobacter africanus]|uniref:Uncharacterized protein n=1 Tax=Pedobacter africanus TaxID=151894 RepID=A0A1W2EFE5_9SPHI|nr:hypothetical protein [Pedobacter africanus]SMD08375.1 hypothetical protein SAMN04488524_4756 [Pedobacter africanus]